MKMSKRVHFLCFMSVMIGFGAVFLTACLPNERLDQPIPEPPFVINPEPVVTTTPIHLSDGRIVGFTPMPDGEVGRSETMNNGKTWSEPIPLHPADGGPNTPGASVWDKDGRLHLFYLQFRQGRRFLELHHRRSSEDGTTWEESRIIIPDVFIGALFDAICLESGRILVPLHYRVRERKPPAGSNITTVVYSDNNGETWTQSSAQITAPCFEGYNGNNFGACEPRLLVMKDSRIWMLIRTQAGFLYESFSLDEGTTWSLPEPSLFYSTNSPGCAVRMIDGRIVVFWNNCENTTPFDGHGVYTTRDALHAAISDDEGQTWRGFREVYLDPFRNIPPPERGDRGTAYPRAVATDDNKILLITGQGEGRRVQILLDPEWLYLTRRVSDFSDSLNNWSVFKRYLDGDRVSRMPGCELIPHPIKTGAKVLHIRRPDEKRPDVAEWNFPAGQSGSVSIRMMLKEGFSGAAIDLADRYFQPTDVAAVTKRIYHLPINADGHIGGTEVYLKHEQWYSLVLRWNVTTDELHILIDNKKAGIVKKIQSTHLGISYLLMRSTAEKIDLAGFLVESVQADIEEPLIAKPKEKLEPIRPPDIVSDNIMSPGMN
jgi:hypothetical protein